MAGGMTTLSGLGFTASATVEPCRFIKVSGNGTYAHAGSNEDVLGISDRYSRHYNDVSAADAGEGAPVKTVDGDIAYLELGGTVTAGAYLIAGANGVGVAAATTGTTVQNIGAQALKGGASGEIIPVKIKVMKHRPALT